MKGPIMKIGRKSGFSDAVASVVAASMKGPIMKIGR